MLKRMWTRAEAWLRREAYVKAVVEAAASSAYQKGFIEGHAQGANAGQQLGYQVGHAHGELHGRQQQTLELQREFGVEDNYNVFDEAAALRIGSRLKH